jgi:hypothetical protein
VTDPIRIVREPDPSRIAAATRAVLGELARPRPAGQWATDYLAPALARRAINADDDHGRGRSCARTTRSASSTRPSLN